MTHTNDYGNPLASIPGSEATFRAVRDFEMFGYGLRNLGGLSLHAGSPISQILDETLSVGFDLLVQVNATGGATVSNIEHMAPGQPVIFVQNISPDDLVIAHGGGIAISDGESAILKTGQIIQLVRLPNGTWQEIGKAAPRVLVEGGEDIALLIQTLQGDMAAKMQAFPNRAAFVSWAGSASPSAGMQVIAGDQRYQFNGAMNVISDLPGWFPVGDQFTPQHFGAVGNGTADDTAALDALWAFVHIQPYNRNVYFPPGVYLYSGSGLHIQSNFWTVRGDPTRTRIHRTTNGKYIVIDARLSYRNDIEISGLAFSSSLSPGSRSNTHGIQFLADPNNADSGFQRIVIEKITGNSLRSIVNFTKTVGALWDNIAQLQRYYQITIREVRGSRFDATADWSDFGLLWDSGTGNHLHIEGCFLRVREQAVKIGDGDMAVHDITFVGNHFLGSAGGVRILGPTNPAKYRKNVLLIGNQFDAAQSGYTYSFENMSHFTATGNNSQMGVNSILTNCSHPYMVEDNQRNLTLPSLRVQGAIHTTEAAIVDTYGTRINQASGFRRNVNDESLRISGGNLVSEGAQLLLYGGDHPNWPSEAYINSNQFVVRSPDGQGSMLRVNSALQALSFFGAAPVTKRTIAGSRSSGAALSNLLLALSQLGLITDSTTP